jgi:hypothetical protein
MVTAEKAQALLDFWNSGFPPTQVSGLKWVNDASVSTPYATNYVDPAAQGWNGITPKVNLAKGTATNNNIKFYVAAGLIAGRNALTTPYCAAGTLGACVEASSPGGTSPTPVPWTKVTIHIYDNIMTGQSYNADQRKRTITHEVGHALSMRHNPNDFTPATASQQTIMSPFISQFSQFSSLDTANLKSKWGQ